MKYTENEFRDFLFDNYREGLADIIVGIKEPISWDSEEPPPIHFLLQERAEKKINQVVEDLSTLRLIAKELRLNRAGESATRIDIFGNSPLTGPTIIELKKSKQTERQSFTELLAYANHFCNIFPSLIEKTITTILIAPMEGRTVKDAFAQELLVNNKTIIALIPEEIENRIILRVHYPDSSYYRWFESNLLNDRSMLTVAISFPLIDGWIDNDIASEDSSPPAYTKARLNNLSSSISSRLESIGVHSMIYCSQLWGEISHLFPNPNTVYIVAVNPFSSYRTEIHDDKIIGSSDESRLADIQHIHDQLEPNDRDSWLDIMESKFHEDIIKLVINEFDTCFQSHPEFKINREISIPDWYGIKTSMIDAVTTHNLDIYLTGLLNDVYTEYMRHIYKTNQLCIHYSDDLPKFLMDSRRNFLAVWEILSGIGLGDQVD